MKERMDSLFENSGRLLRHIRDRLRKNFMARPSPETGAPTLDITAAVLFLLGPAPDGTPALILNQRSSRVRQAGDLCFPGGGVSPRLDRFLSLLLFAPGLPLFSRRWRGMGRELTLLLATSLRESFEEIRLSPFRTTFLGAMPPVCLRRFNRAIHPMAAWTESTRFSPNWEVARIVPIPLTHFFRAEAYGRMLLLEAGPEKISRELPCLIYPNGDGREILWGVTYAMVMNFLTLVFDFTPPEISTLPVVWQKSEAEYLNPPEPEAFPHPRKENTL